MRIIGIDPGITKTGWGVIQLPSQDFSDSRFILMNFILIKNILLNRNCIDSEVKKSILFNKKIKNSKEKEKNAEIIILTQKLIELFRENDIYEMCIQSFISKIIDLDEHLIKYCSILDQIDSIICKKFQQNMLIDNNNNAKDSHKINNLIDICQKYSSQMDRNEQSTEENSNNKYNDNELKNSSANDNNKAINNKRNILVKDFLPQYVSHGIINTKSTTLMHKRLELIYTGISKAIQDFNPQSATLEEVFVNQSNPASTLKLGSARGVISLAIAHNNIEIMEILAGDIKYAMCLKWRGEKQDIKMIVFSILNLQNTRVALDSSDSLASAICSIMKIN